MALIFVVFSTSFRNQKSWKDNVTYTIHTVITSKSLVKHKDGCVKFKLLLHKLLVLTKAGKEQTCSKGCIYCITSLFFACFCWDWSYRLASHTFCEPCGFWPLHCKSPWGFWAPSQLALGPMHSRLPHKRGWCIDPFQPAQNWVTSGSFTKRCVLCHTGGN